MIRVATFQTEAEMARFFNAHAIDIGDVYTIYVNASNRWVAMFAGEASGVSIIDTSPGLAGVAVASQSGVGTGGELLEVTAARTNVSGESFPRGTTVSGTLVQTYVIPRSTSFTDDDGVAPPITDDGLGKLIERETLKICGDIDYQTGVFSIDYSRLRLPTAAIYATYQASELPDSDPVPTRAELSALVIEAVGATEVAWAIYEEAAAAHPPVAQGTGTLTNGVLTVNLLHLLSTALDRTARTSRWVGVTPDATADVRVRLTWRRVN